MLVAAERGRRRRSRREKNRGKKKKGKEKKKKMRGRDKMGEWTGGKNSSNVGFCWNIPK